MSKKILTTFLCLLLVLLGWRNETSFAADIGVSATVPPKPTDFEFSFAATDAQASVPQNTMLSYEITYGAKPSAGSSTTTTLVADYSDVAPNGLPLFDYVIGSADDAYGGTHPVIDVNNNKITWTIPNLPAGVTNQTVRFTLKTNSNYTVETPVALLLKAKMNNQYVALADETITQQYLFASTLVTGIPTQTPTPTPVSNPTMTPTITPTTNPTTGITITPTPTNMPAIAAVTFNDIAATNATITITTTAPSTISIRYGTTPNALSQTLANDDYTLSHEITLGGLSSNTTYYFQITASTKTGTKFTSDLFTFKAAQISEKPAINEISVVITSSDIVLFAGNEQPGTKPIVVIPQNLPYSFRFTLSNYSSIKKVQAIVRNKQVLGITTTDEQDPSTSGVALIDRGNGVFEGRLSSSVTPGVYEIYVRIWDTKGNLTENKVSDLQVSQPLTILDPDKNPIEGVQILLSFYNKKTNKYEILSPQIFPIKNPSYTDIKGQINIPLPQGTYKVTVTALGFERKEVPFTIGAFPGEGYPTIQLLKQPFNIVTLTQYYGAIAGDTISLTRLYIQGLSNSLRFFELNSLIVTATLVFLTLFAFSRRLKIPLRSLLAYFSHLGKIKNVQKALNNIIKGRIFDEHGQTITGVEVFLLNNTNSILNHTTTDSEGNFIFLKQPQNTYTIQLMKQGYEPVIILESQIQAVGLGGYLLSMQRHPHGLKIKERSIILFEKILSLLFETLLVMSFAFELSLGYALGWEKVLPFLLISIINLCLWLVHMVHMRTQKNLF